MSTEHPSIPPDEWDARHIDWDTETCALCGSELAYLGDEMVGVEAVKCKQSGETLHLL
jgi:alpha-D-ribose 1-methylphosphonate 5-phosphate C-P lyase